MLTCVSFFQSTETVVPLHVLKNNLPVGAQGAPSVPKLLELDQTESPISDKMRHSRKPFLKAPEDLQIPKIKQWYRGSCSAWDSQNSNCVFLNQHLSDPFPRSRGSVSLQQFTMGKWLPNYPEEYPRASSVMACRPLLMIHEYQNN